MKILSLIAAGAVALTGAAAPVAAQHTTVTRVHGPVHLLPHHNRKICTTRYMHHKRVRKCHYN